MGELTGYRDETTEQPDLGDRRHGRSWRHRRQAATVRRRTLAWSPFVTRFVGPGWGWGVELLDPGGLLSQVTMAVLERAGWGDDRPPGLWETWPGRAGQRLVLRKTMTGV